MVKTNNFFIDFFVLENSKSPPGMADIAKPPNIPVLVEKTIYSRRATLPGTEKDVGKISIT